jgi:transcriptional regulator GlxA family with amidase domain
MGCFFLSVLVPVLFWVVRQSGKGQLLDKAGFCMDPRIQEVIVSMTDDLQRDTSLAEMAKSVSLSPSHFSLLFKRETGESPGRYLRALRRKKATELLETTWLKVKDICAMIGIHDASHFVRDFKQLYGLSPGEYRKTEPKKTFAYLNKTAGLANRW